MQRREASIEFVRAFCSGDLDRIGSLLAEDFRFRGPLLSCDSRRAYLDALADSPPDEDATFKLLKAFEDESEVCLLYEYSRSGSSVVIAQWTQFAGELISEMRLVFDPSQLA